MNTGSKDKLLGVDSPRPATAEQRVRQLGIQLPAPPEPFGIYAEAVQTGNLLFLTGMLPTAGRLPGGAQRPRCCAAAFRIARQSYADRPARRVGGHFGRFPGTPENR
jgi:hypothetical protein